MERRLVSSGSAWEGVVGYSRAVRAGAFVAVAGTTAVDADGRVVGEGSVYEQTRFVLGKIGAALEEAGARYEDVVRTRMFVVNIAEWDEVARAHAEVFGKIRPAATMVEVKRLIEPGLLMEIEVDAVVAAVG